jgi:hypothetical protein
MTRKSFNWITCKVDELSHVQIVMSLGSKVDIKYSVEMSRLGLALSGHLMQL